jgi:hypothetical protein
VSNARRRLEPEAEPPTEAREPLDPLAPYRDQVAALALAGEELTRLHSLEVSLRADADGVASARDKVLADSVIAAGDDQEACAELGRLRNRAEIYERKIADIARQVSQAEAEASQEFITVKNAFVALWRTFYGFCFAGQVARFKGLLAEGVGIAILEQCAVLSREIAQIKSLEPTGNDAQSLSVQATRLLERVAAAEGFTVPAPPPEAKDSGLGASAGPLEDDYSSGPWDDGTGQLQLEIKKLEAEGATFADLIPRLKARCPRFFKNREQTLGNDFCRSADVTNRNLRDSRAGNGHDW